jgi:hypothetical protein
VTPFVKPVSTVLDWLAETNCTVAGPKLGAAVMA